MINAENRKELEELCLPLVEWLNNNTHPHAKIIIEPKSYELVEGVTAGYTEKFIKG